MDIILEIHKGVSMKCRIAVLMLLIIGVLSAKTFTGAEDNNWSNPNNWDPPGVPNMEDVVTIDEGSTCNIDQTFVDFGIVNNRGTLQINTNCIAKTSSMNNYGSIEGSGNLTMYQPSDVSGLSVENTGTINLREGSLTVLGNPYSFMSSSSVTNDGRIEAGFVYVKTDLVSNDNRIRGGYVSINANSNLRNDGGITGEAFWDESNPAGNIHLRSNDAIDNNGFIMAGSSETGSGGWITIDTKILNNVNTMNSRIEAGSGTTDGFICIFAQKVNDWGRIEAGAITETMDLDDDMYGPVRIFADSIVIAPEDSGRIRADSLIVAGNHIDIRGTRSGDIVAMDMIEIYTTEDGTLDMSDIAGMNVIGSDTIVFRSDDIVEPLGGFLLSVLPAPVIEGYTERRAEPVVYNEPITLVDTDSLTIFGRNISNIAESIPYSLESMHLGASGGFLELSPFEGFGIGFTFDIAASEDTLYDTLTLILTMDTGDHVHEIPVTILPTEPEEETDEYVYEIKNGWNMISHPFILPIIDTMSSPNIIPPMFGYHPDSSSYFYVYGSAFGKSIWMLHYGDTSLVFERPSYSESLTDSVFYGWNMMGMVNRVIPSADMAERNPILIPPFYYWDADSQNYFADDTLRPEHGYWFLSGEDGEVEY